MEAAKQDAKEHYTQLKAEGITSSRDAMLKSIQQSQPALVYAPMIPAFAPYFDDVLQKFIDVLNSIGGRVYVVNSYEELIAQIKIDFAGAKRIVSFENIYAAVAEIADKNEDPHSFENVDVCIMSFPP